MNFARGMPVAGGLVQAAKVARTKPLVYAATSVRSARFTWAVLPGRSLHAHSVCKRYLRAPLHMRTPFSRQEPRPGVPRIFDWRRRIGMI